MTKTPVTKEHIYPFRGMYVYRESISGPYGTVIRHVYMKDDGDRLSITKHYSSGDEGRLWEATIPTGVEEFRPGLTPKDARRILERFVAGKPAPLYFTGENE